MDDFQENLDIRGKKYEKDDKGDLYVDDDDDDKDDDDDYKAHASVHCFFP